MKEKTSIKSRLYKNVKYFTYPGTRGHKKFPEIVSLIQNEFTFSFLPMYSTSGHGVWTCVRVIPEASWDWFFHLIAANY